MKLEPYVNKLNNSQEYKDFSKKHNDAFLFAGFFVLDYESGKNMHQIDFYVPSKKKIAAFSLDNKVEMQMLEMMHNKVPGKLDIKTKVDLDALKGILQDEMKNRGMTEEIRKIIAIIQNIDGKKIWNLNCVLSGMEILRAHVEDENKSVLKMERSSIMDYIQKMNPQQLAELQQKATEAKGNVQQMPMPENIDPKTKKKIEQLNELEAALRNEKKNAAAEDKAKKSKPKKK